MTPNRPIIAKRIAILSLASAIAFAGLSLAVSQGVTSAIDHDALLALRNPADVSDPLGPGWLQEAAVELTALGGYTVLILATLLTAIGLLLARKGRAAGFLSLAVAGGSALSTALKSLIERPRPDLVAHLDPVATSSFPSAHAMVSMLTWLTLAAILVRFVEGHALRVFILASAFTLSIAIGVSRVYLGVHWPSDVAAGWCLGLAWAGGCWLLAHSLTSDRETARGLGHSKT